MYTAGHLCAKFEAIDMLISSHTKASHFFQYQNWWPRDILK